jgi:hypothetical protein
MATVHKDRDRDHQKSRYERKHVGRNPLSDDFFAGPGAAGVPNVQ